MSELTLASYSVHVRGPWIHS